MKPPIPAAVALAVMLCVIAPSDTRGEIVNKQYRSIDGVFCLTEQHGQILAEAMLRDEAEGEKKLIELERTLWCFRGTLLFEIVGIIKTERVATRGGNRMLFMRRGRGFLFSGTTNLFSGESKSVPLPIISISLENEDTK